MGRNVDFVAVLVITLVLLTLGWARSAPSRIEEALDSIQVTNAVTIERIQPRDFFSQLNCILHR
jgi:hypothetical protein